MYMRVYTWFYTVRGSGVVHCPLGDVLGKRWMRAPLLFRVTRHAAHWHLGFLKGEPCSGGREIGERLTETVLHNRARR